MQHKSLGLTLITRLVPLIELVACNILLRRRFSLLILVKLSYFPHHLAHFFLYKEHTFDLFLFLKSC